MGAVGQRRHSKTDGCSREASWGSGFTGALLWREVVSSHLSVGSASSDPSRADPAAWAVGRTQAQGQGWSPVVQGGMPVIGKKQG